MPKWKIFTETASTTTGSIRVSQAKRPPLRRRETLIETDEQKHTKLKDQPATSSLNMT